MVRHRRSDMNKIPPYIAGFIAADGHLSKSKIVSISQSEDGLDLLYEFSKILEVNLPHERRLGHKHFGKKRMFCLSFKVDDVAVNDLRSWGIPIGKKSYVLSFPKQKDEFVWEYLRGYFDGDGSVSRDRYGYSRVQIISNDSWCQSCNDFLRKNNILSFVSKDKRHPGISNVHIRRNNHIHSFMNRLYFYGSDIKLDWKYKKWMSIAKKCPKYEKERKFKSECNDLVISLLNEGQSYASIAKRVGCSIALVGKIKTSSFGSLRDLFNRKEKEIDKLLLSGKSRTQITNMGYGYKLVKKVFEKRFGLSKDLSRKRMEDKYKNVQQMLISGFSYKDIAKSVKVDFGTISRIKKFIKGEIK